MCFDAFPGKWAGVVLQRRERSEAPHSPENAANSLLTRLQRRHIIPLLESVFSQSSLRGGEKKMKNYVEPSMIVEVFQADVITASGEPELPKLGGDFGDIEF